MIPVVLVVTRDDTLVRAVTVELARDVPDVDVVTAGAQDEAVASARAVAASGGIVAVVLIDDDGPDVSGLLRTLHDAAGAATRLLLVTGQDHVDGVGPAIAEGHLHGIVATPWTTGEFARHMAAQVRRALRAAGTADVPAGLLDEPAGRDRAPAVEALEAPQEDAAAALLAAIDRVLRPRPRLRLAPGTVLVREGEEVNGVFIVISGDVQLSRRTPYGDERLHRQTAGPVIGLLSFTQQRLAFVTAVTTSPVVAAHLTLEQLDQAMRHDSEVATLFSAVLLRSLATRLVRADELHLEVRALNRELAAERDRLADALARLEAAEVLLVETAQMATLGELSAGIAHELNNPVGALQRSAAFVASDLAQLLAPDDRAVLREAVAGRPPSSSDLRQLRRVLESALGDADLAARLVRAGVTDVDQARVLADAGRDVLARRTTLHQLGVALRNTTSASERIAGLVASLRAYVRGNASAGTVDTDVRAGLDDTLAILGHRLEGVDVERRYATDVPHVPGRAGELNQVWTNLLANAADALDGTGTIDVEVDTPTPGEVRVRIIDDGPGIPPEVLPRIFEPRFTTKAGRVEYGLGLGLAIAKRLVDAHRGTIELASRPGRTVATVVLPVER